MIDAKRQAAGNPDAPDPQAAFEAAGGVTAWTAMFEAARRDAERPPRQPAPARMRGRSRSAGDRRQRGAGMDATARTGNVPVPWNGAGIALNQAPSTGTAPRFVMCSQIGIPARSRPECAGRAGSAGVVDVQRVDPDDRCARRDEELHRSRGRGTGCRAHRPRSASGDRTPCPLARPSPRGRGPRTPAAWIARRARTRGVDPDGGRVHQALERERREVGASPRRWNGLST